MTRPTPTPTPGQTAVVRGLDGTRPRRRLRRAPVVLGLALALLLPACTSGSDPAPAPSAADRSATGSPTPTGGGAPPPAGSRAPTTATAGGAATAGPAPGTARPAAPPAALRRFYGQQPHWSGCGGQFECASITVPLDYAEPAGTTIRLATVRLRTTQRSGRIGSLLLNPGGPGGSAVDYARSAESVLSDGLRRAYDIVGFDPRGVVGSAPIRCRTDAQIDADIALDPSPDTAAERAAITADARSIGARCAAHNGPILAHVSTVETARDMDIVRGVVGDDRLHYLGASYGTLLGATYADLFPGRVGALVLDGAVDPTLSDDQFDQGQAEGFDLALRSFLTDCLSRSTCPVPGPIDRATAAVADLLARADRSPLPTGTSRRLTEGRLTLGLVTPLYDRAGGWPALRGSLRAAVQGDGSAFLRLADLYSSRDDDGHYADNSNDSSVAISCLDRAAPDGVARRQALAVRFARSAPVFGPALAWGSLPCATWPERATGTRKALHAAGAAPILVVGTTRDPATPYPWAVSLARQLDSGVLLTRDGDGHTGYHRGSACTDAAVDAYLLGRSVPPDGKRCG